MTRDLRTVLRALRAAGVPVIVLKGAYLAETVYPHPALRPMSDVDLLVMETDRVRADAVVRGLGFRRGIDAHSWAFDLAYDGATFYDGDGGARLDVHWRLLNDPRYGWNAAEADALWHRAVPVMLGGEEALGLAAEDLVLSLATHLAIHHGLTGLVWYWDLALVLDRWSASLDWGALRDRAERWRVRRAVFFALSGLRELFPLPNAVDGVLGRLSPRGPRAAAMRWLVRRRAERLGDLDHVIPLVLADRLRDVVRALGPAVCPSPGWVRARYGDDGQPLWRGYVAHAARTAGVVRHAGRQLTWRAQ
jgi:hypothetical protein